MEFKGEKLAAKDLTVREVAELRRWLRKDVKAGEEPTDEDVWAKTVIVGAMKLDGTPRWPREALESVKDLPYLAIMGMFNEIARANGLGAEEEAAVRSDFPKTPTGSSSSG